MGAMAGIIFKGDYQNSQIKEGLMNKFKNDYHKTYSWQSTQVSFCVSHTDVSPQSIYENGPILDEESNLLIVADAIIDNREELLEKLNIKGDKMVKSSDSMLILEAFKKWGVDSISYFIGEFSFVIYNTVDRTAFIVRDQLGANKVYYYENNKFMAFATSMSVLIKTFDKKPILNDIWIANFLSIESPIHDVLSAQTVYKEIMQLDPAHYMIYEDELTSIMNYWKVDIHKETQISFEDACNGLNETLGHVIEQKIKTTGNVGICLSSGLDSTTVAAFANDFLATENKTLFAYTSIPLRDYQVNHKGYYIENESEYLTSFLDMYSNIQHKYIDANGKNSITDIEKHLEYLEHPYKFIENNFWIDEIYRMASEDGCKIILSGGYGNCTISEGLLPVHVKTLINKGKYFQAFKSINQFTNHINAGKKKTFSYFAKQYLYKDNKKTSFSYDDILINQVVAKEVKLDEMHRSLRIGQYQDDNADIYELRQFYTSLSVMSQISSMMSSTYRRYGMQIIDPTFDIRVIEFCFSLPFEHYVRKGKERELLRETMKGKLPNNIRLNYNRRGIQSADWIFRLQSYTKEIKNELYELLQDELVQYYLNKKLLLKELDNLEMNIQNQEKKRVWKIVVSLICAKFLKMYQMM